MKLSIIIITYNTKNITKECLAKVKNSKDNLKKEIIVVDNASTDGSVEMIKKEFPKVILIENKKNVGFARANIQAEKIAKGKYILLLNSDAFIKECTLEKTVKFMEKNLNCGVLGVRLINRNGKLQSSAYNFPTPLRLFFMRLGGSLSKFNFSKGMIDKNVDNKSTEECDWVPGCYFLIRRKVIDDIGFLDRNYFMYYEDVDFCLRAKRKDWKVIFYPKTKVIHLGRETAKKMDPTKKQNDIEKYSLESEFIYFRKNYNLFYVLFDFLFISLFDLIQILKRIILNRKRISINERLNHTKLAYRIFVSTKFGNTPIS